jgi:DNA-binding CsgD family transcriptional regulator
VTRAQSRWRRQWFGDAGFDVLARRARRSRPKRSVSPVGSLGISRRGADVLGLIIDGCSNKEIAERLSCRPHRRSTSSLLRKTASRSRTQLRCSPVRVGENT